MQVTRNGERVRVTRNPVHDGYAQPTLVWEMPDSIARSGTFEVVVSRIRRSGSKKRFTSSYSVSMFTPTR